MYGQIRFSTENENLIDQNLFIFISAKLLLDLIYKKGSILVMINYFQNL